VPGTRNLIAAASVCVLFWGCEKKDRESAAKDQSAVDIADTQPPVPAEADEPVDHELVEWTRAVDSERSPENLAELGRVLRVRGDYVGAESILNEGLELLRRSHDRETRSSVLYQLGAVYTEQRKLDEAIDAYRESLRMSEEIYGPNAEATGNTLEALAGVLDYAERYEEAETMFRRALAIAKEVHGSKSHEVGHAMVNLGLNMVWQGRPAEGRKMYRKAIPILRTTEGYERIALASAHNGIASLHREAGELARAEKSFRRALEVRIEAVGAEHPLVAMSLHNMAIILDERGQVSEALEHCSRAEEIRQRAFDDEHPLRISTEELCQELRVAVSETQTSGPAAPAKTANTP